MYVNEDASLHHLLYHHFLLIHYLHVIRLHVFQYADSSNCAKYCFSLKSLNDFMLLLSINSVSYHLISDLYSITWHFVDTIHTRNDNKHQQAA